MAFRAGTALRPAPPGELASIHMEERPSESSSCERKRTLQLVLWNNEPLARKHQLNRDTFIPD